MPYACKKPPGGRGSAADNEEEPTRLYALGTSRDKKCYTPRSQSNENKAMNILNACNG